MKLVHTGSIATILALALAGSAQAKNLGDSRVVAVSPQPSGAIAGTGEEARVEAGTFDVTPTRVDLEQERSAGLVVTNRAGDLARFRVEIMAWSQDANGRMVLFETDDVVVNPTTFSLQAGEQRSITLALAGERAHAEKTYRVFIREIPAHDDGWRTDASVDVLRRAAVPLFVPPKWTVSNGGPRSVALRDDALTFEVANTGNVHFRIGKVRIVGLDDDGDVVFDRSIRGGYVLPGAARPVRLDLTPDECRRIRHVAITVASRGQSWSDGFDLQSSACSAGW